MVFKRLFKPKWQHSDPEVRRQAIIALAADDDASDLILRQLVQEDADAGVRKMAVNRLRDPQVLREVMAGDADAPVREQAGKKLARLLAGLEGGVDLTRRQQMLSEIGDEDVLGFVLRQGVEAEIRLVALSRVERESLLGDLAIGDADAGLRMAAVKRLTQQSTLKRVAAKVRSRDKKVYQYAQERLDQMQLEQERPKRLRSEALDLCKQLETLGKARDLAGTGAYRDRLAQQWQSMQSDWQQAGLGPFDAELNLRYDAALTNYEQVYAAYLSADAERSQHEQKLEQLSARKQEICEALESLLQACNSGQCAEDTDLDGRLQASQAQWRALEPLLPEKEREFTDRFDALCKHLSEISQDIRNHERGTKLLQSLQQKLHKRLDDKRVLTARELAQLAERMQSLPSLRRLSYDGRDQQVRDLLSQLEARKAVEEKRLQDDVRRYRKLVADAEQALADGQSTDLNSLMKSIRRLEKRLPPGNLQEIASENLRQRVSVLASELNRIRDWQRWAGTPHKQALTEEMEALAREVESTPQSIYDFTALAKQVQAARDEWKKLGEADPALAESLWQRFNDACNRAYAPCEGYFQQLDEQRQENRKKKDLICDTLEQFLAGADWEAMDWSKVVNILKVADGEWRQLGPVGREDQGRLNKRFRKAMDALRERLEANRRENSQAKEALLAGLQKLLDDTASVSGDSAELSQALSRARNLQSEWKGIGPAADDRKRWKKFRALNDELFGRRHAHIEAQKEEQERLLQEREQIIQDIKELAGSVSESAMSPRARFDELKKQWEQSPALPAGVLKEPNNRYRAACRDFSSAREGAKRRQQIESLQMLDRKLDLCANMEGLAAGEHGGQSPETLAAERESLQASWAALPVLPDMLEVQVQKRFQDAVDRVMGTGEEVTTVSEEDIRRATEILIVRLEILADVQSPAEFKQQRMEYQLSTLADRMRGEQMDGSEEMLNILLAWCALPGMRDRIAATALAARFQRVRDEYLQHHLMRIFD